MNHTIALLGGTFDPIHYGHLRLAAEVRTALDFAEARLIPAGHPPHRPPPVASAEHRLAMTEIGCGEFPGLAADGREARNPRLSYTVSTLQDLHAEQPKLPLALIVGTDAFADLIQWHHWEQLFTLAHLIVVERPGASLDIESLPPALKAQWERRLTTDRSRLSRQLAGAIYRQEVTLQPISATAIRNALASGPRARSEIAGLLPAAVLAYIDRNQLYRSRQDAP